MRGQRWLEERRMRPTSFVFLVLAKETIIFILVWGLITGVCIFYFTVHPNKVFEINPEDLWAPILHWCLDIKPAVQTWWKYFVLVKTIFEWSQFLHYLLYGQIYRTSKIIKSNYIYKWNKHWRCSSICKAWKYAWFKVQGSTTCISKNIYLLFLL